MHEAYQVSQLLKLNVQIESIAAYDENLLVGTRQGHLLMYKVVTSLDDKQDVQLMRYNKTFSKRAIQQLDVIPEHNLLVCLTDGIIQVHDISVTNFPVIHQAARTKGANIFTMDSKVQTSLTGEKSVLVRICVAVKRKLQFYYWKNVEFMKLVEDISLSDIPKALTWCQETICVGFRGEYSLFELDGNQRDLFPTSSSKSSDPCIMKISDTTFALGREMQTVLVNVKGDAEKAKALRWTSVPIALSWDEPYTIGLLPETIEIQTIESGGVVQVLDTLPNARLIAVCKQGMLYVASVSQIWCLYALDISKQREMLLKDKQFQLALTLTRVSKETEEDKNEKIHHIQTLLAYDLFGKKEFSKSMKEFLKLDTDPYDVIRLFPDLLPQSSSIEPSETSSGLSERQLEEGLLALIEYLIEVRRKLQNDCQPTINASGNLNDKPNPNKSTQQLLQIIDTTLLKCYLQTNDALVAPLLRLNHCHLAETERILKKYGKHNELIILYQTKGQHRRALELLQTEKSVDKTISYLQHLGGENMGLVLEFSDWILKESPEEGLKIFTEDLLEVENMPRPRVLDFLLRSHPTLVIPYLEHVVHTWEDTNPLFHNALVHQYREQAIDGDGPAAQHIQKKLFNFLDSSKFYTPETVLMHFPNDKLLEARATILGRLGRHEQALFIYVRVLGDIPRAVSYCSKIYETVSETIGEEVYVSLIKLILDPNSVSMSLPTSCLSPITSQPNLETALELLEEFGSRINPLLALAIIPDSVHVSRICKFLQTAIHKSIQNRRQAQLLRGLLYAEHLQCQEARLEMQSQSVHITDLNVCPVCKKRFGNQSAFVRYPNGDVVHYSCHDRKM